MLVAFPRPALAHGLSGRLDLPVPRWLFVYGAATALLVSFVALAVLWREPRLQEPKPHRPLPWQGLWRSVVIERGVRAISFALFVLLVAAAFAGPDRGNIAPVLVFVWFWVGLAFAHAVFGNLWGTLSPWDTFARYLRFEDALRPYPKAWGVWPAALFLFAFTWVELVAPWAPRPRPLGIAIVAYTIITIVGIVVFGRETWKRNGEAFAVYFGLLARISPLARDEDGRLVARPLLGGLPLVEPRPGLVAFVAVALGSTTFDGVSRTSLWFRMTAGLSGISVIIAGTLGLAVTILLVALAYSLAMGAAGRVASARWHPLAVRFVHSLVPIAFAYVVAHYFSLLLIEGQQGLIYLSDPFGLGWNLLGTADWTVNLTIVSTTVIWYVQVAAIVSGHIEGVVLAHDRAVALFPPKVATRTQYALLAVMILFTAVGLLILSGG